MTQSEESNFELRDDDNTPTKLLISGIDFSATSDGTNQLEPGSLVGRYIIRKRIGAGGFGVVYLGEDSVLKRDVCIKISRTPESSLRSNQFSLIAEARSAASLDHPNVVRVFDTGLWNNYPFLIMEYVAGATLGHQMIASQPISIRRALMLMKQVALALAHLHSKGLIHRDLKPANILISPADVVKLTDFGLAISDDMPAWNKQQIAGTQRYMAPEQVLGETHRIDGRTDIWGFGVVLYEILTSKPPFRATDPKTLFQSILKGDAPSLRQRRPDVPQSLDQFCLRCLSQCMTDRYQSATELLEDLEIVQNSLEDSNTTEPRTSSTSPQNMHANPALGQESSGHSANSNQPAGSTKKLSKTENLSGTQSSGVSIGHLELLPIVPRGLQSFDDEDHYFFLKLIPGPRGAQGTPLSLRFWKNWVASQDGELMQCVGVLYGPSGSGKSSFIKAGLLPLIRQSTDSIYVDFTVERPVAALLSRLHKHFPDSTSHSDLASTLAFIRNKTPNKTTLIVLDQFEQYLANTPLNLQHELVQSLRQCDGSGLKAILLVRDDFWNSISQFMHLLESSLSDQRNAMSLPLLNQQHAERTLEAIGRAYECLPKAPETISETQRSFIELAVQQLSHEGYVVCVRLAMFAELMRKHPWEPKTLSRLGGMDGAAMKYLEESFDAHTAPISHRSVASICREILRALLPQTQVDTKSTAKSKKALSDLVCRTESQVEFEQAIRVLESELRLISAVGQGVDGKPLYSLTHDYLVKPIKNWIFNHEQSTWQGRARSRLTSLAARYDCEPNYRNLPSVSEWFSIQSSVPQARRTESEKQWMRFANRFVFAKLLSVAAAVSILLGGTWLIVRAQNAVWQAERNKSVAAIDLFLASKPDGLELAQKGVRGLKRLYNNEYANKRKLGEPDYDRRLTLLGAAVGANLEPERVVKAVDESEIEIQPIWRTVFANATVRDSVLEAMSADARFSARMHWLFLANDDFRTLIAIEQSQEPSAIVLCHQIVACALEEPSSTAYWNPAKLEKVVAQKSMDSELHPLVTLLLGLVSPSDPIDLQRIERQAVASQAAIAMPAQWFIEKSKNSAVEFTPAEPNESDWRIEKPFPGVSIPMIRLPAGAMVYTPPASKKDAGLKNKPFGIFIDEDLWITEEKISFDVATEFVKSQSSPLGLKLGNKNGNATFTNANAIFKFCNWLSEISGYEPTYKFKDSSTGESELELEETNGVFIKRDTDGFRIPIREEFLYMATCAEQSQVTGVLYSNVKMFNSTRTLRPSDPRASFLSTPSPWGIKNIFSIPAELFVDTTLGKLAVVALGEASCDNFSILPIADAYINQAGIRLVRGPLRMPSSK